MPNLNKQNSPLDTKNSQNSVNFSPNSAQNSQNSHAKFKPYIFCFMSILCLHWTLASYQSFINTIGILLCGGIIALIIDEKGDLKVAFYKSRFMFISVILATISYKITFDILKQLGISKELYSTKLVGMSDLLGKIESSIRFAFNALFSYQSLSIPFSMSVLFVIFIPILLICLWILNLKFRAKVVIFVLLLGAVVASMVANMLSGDYATRSDIMFTGLLIVRVLILALAFKFSFELFHTKNIVQNTLFVVSMIIIWFCVVLNLQYQRTQKQASDAEFRLLNQVVDRFSSDENFSYDKKYCGVMFGRLEPMRLRYSINKNEGGFGSNYAMVNDIFHEEVFSSNDILKWLMPQNVFSECKFYISYVEARENYKDKKFLSLLSRLDEAGILETLQPWPHKNSVVVFEDIVVFVASKGNLDEIRQKAKEWRKE